MFRLLMIELVASNSGEGAKKLVSGSSLVVSKHRYDSILQDLVAAGIKDDPFRLCDSKQSLLCPDLTGFMTLTQS